ncbi:PAS domain-containing sensor histidine kinase [Candidatus Bealeia paramacronuclearis]|uniref:histidine kinase n=1 Tax=Candidatus Bealeia paramacronuclearis TaxID=1921001 RepID=A0ABZ2C4M9_9PROT|nr:PAS domain-containing sensor histidine kinase [Candidatus Bealeia paramacronuclearis]
MLAKTFKMEHQNKPNLEFLLMEGFLNIDEGVAIYDPEDRLVLVNPIFEGMFPSTIEIAKDQPYFRDLVKWAYDHGDYFVEGMDYETWYHFRTKYRNEGVPVEYHLKDGRYIRGFSKRTESQNLVTIFTDITYHKQRELALIESKTLAESANRTKSSFLAHVSHELRTPLNAIMGFSEIMSKSLFGPLNNSHYERYVTDILKSGKHLLGIIDDLLQVAKAEVGQLDLRENWCDLCEIVKEVMRLSLLRAEAGGIYLTYEAYATEVPFYGDERKMRQIVTNLVTNALKFTPDSGKVHLQLERTPLGDGLLAITDTGSGIPQEEIPKVLEAFGRIENPFSRKQQEGTGLGLHLTDTFVSLHGGVLEIQSQLNEGTTVFVLLPKERFKDATPGSSRPSSHSKKAPPAVET